MEDVKNSSSLQKDNSIPQREPDTHKKLRGGNDDGYITHGRIGRYSYCTTFPTTLSVLRLVEWLTYCLNLKYNTKSKKKTYKKYPRNKSVHKKWLGKINRIILTMLPLAT